MAVGISLLMVVVFALLSTAHAAAGRQAEAIANAVLAVLMLGGPALLRATARYALAVNLTIALTFGIVLYIVLTDRGAGINAGTVALAEIPLFATLLTGPGVGGLWLVAACAANTLVGIAAQHGLVERAPVNDASLLNDHVVLLLVTATLYLVAALYERGRAQGLEHIAALDALRRREELEKLEAQAEARLAHAERLASLGRIAAAAAHEINNPLSYVANNLEFLQQHASGEQGDDDEASALREALEGVQRIRRIVADLKTYARPDEEAPSSVNVARALDAALKTTQGVLRDKARLVLELSPVGRAVGSEPRLVQVFVNLLTNAAQAIPEGRREEHRVVVRARDAGESIAVEIEDTGEGMPREVLTRAGAPFFTTKRDGMGLGLAVCRTILERTGGALEFESEPGRTLARVTLGKSNEAATGPPPPPDATQERSARKRRARILVIDDEPLVARAIQRRLHDHEVRVDTSGRAALARFEAGERFDLVLCDVMMPEISGVDLYEHMRERHPDMAERLVFMTGATFTDRADDFRSTITAPVLEKPIDIDQVRELLEPLV